MNELLVSIYKKSLGRVVTVKNKIKDPNGEPFIEYVQGVLIDVNEEVVTIEQYLSVYNLFNKIECATNFRVFRVGEFKFEEDLPH